MRSVVSGDVLNVLRNTSYMYQLGWDQRVCLGTTHAVSRSVWTGKGIVATVSPTSGEGGRNRRLAPVRGEVFSFLRGRSEI